MSKIGKIKALFVGNRQKVQPKLDTKADRSGEHWLVSGLRLQKGEREESVRYLNSEIAQTVVSIKGFESRLEELIEERLQAVRRLDEVSVQLNHVLDWKRNDWEPNQTPRTEEI